VIGNSFKNVGGSQAFADTHSHEAALVINGCPPDLGCPGNGFRNSGALVQGNTFDGARNKAMRIAYTDGATITQNEVKNSKCGRETDGAVNELGMHMTYQNINLTVSNNSFHDFDPTGNCTLANQGYSTYAAIWCDVGAGPASQNGTISGNTVFNIDAGKGDFSNPRGLDQSSTGIFIEAGCAGYHVHNNILYDIGSFGLRNSFHSLDVNQAPNVYENNTIVDIAMYGVYMVEGVLTVKNNIIRKAGQTQINNSNPSNVRLTADYNDYDDGGSQTKIGVWGGVGPLTLANWRSTCNCDSHAITANPLFVNESSGDFHLQASSPARGAGEGGVDLGAFPSQGNSSLSPPPNLRVINVTP
jgi:hypothetical protein